MTRSLWVIADDYGLSPGVSAAILDLLQQGRLSGTGCMTVFPDWHEHAARLSKVNAAIGLHLTLTDQVALTGGSRLSVGGRLPSFARLVLVSTADRKQMQLVHAELDAQLVRFQDAFGRSPDYMDGHQHVHFLPVVRDWLKARFRGGSKPWLRGAPMPLRGVGSDARKVRTIRAFAAGFDRAMTAAGFAVKGPLAGAYDWRRPQGFVTALDVAFGGLPDGGIFMCHPGAVDDVLQSRDGFVDGRPIEYALLGSDLFASRLASAGIAIASGQS